MSGQALPIVSLPPTLSFVNELQARRSPAGPLRGPCGAPRADSRFRLASQICSGPEPISILRRNQAPPGGLARPPDFSLSAQQNIVKQPVRNRRAYGASSCARRTHARAVTCPALPARAKNPRARTRVRHALAGVAKKPIKILSHVNPAPLPRSCGKHGSPPL